MDSGRCCCPLASVVAAGYKLVHLLGGRWQLYLHQEYVNTAPLQQITLFTKLYMLFYIFLTNFTIILLHLHSIFLLNFFVF